MPVPGQAPLPPITYADESVGAYVRKLKRKRRLRLAFVWGMAVLAMVSLAVFGFYVIVVWY